MLCLVFVCLLLYLKYQQNCKEKLSKVLTGVLHALKDLGSSQGKKLIFFSLCLLEKHTSRIILEEAII